MKIFNKQISLTFCLFLVGAMVVISLRIDGCSLIKRDRPRVFWSEITSKLHSILTVSSLPK